MKEVKFWITIGGDIGDENGIELWKAIRNQNNLMCASKDNKRNMMILPTETYVYGYAAEYELQDILYRCAKFGYPVKLNIT